MKNKEVVVPDKILPYLNEIAKRIWADRAAVMVGAGFSKNAEDGFPDWNQLGDILYKKAQGINPDESRQKYLNVLRLAEEVQASIGRPALENLLRSNIPDLTVEPSKHHVELLKLPWVDVFTTNYDSLLERASAKVVTRRYEPVFNKEDIPYAKKPRIVKLHGSFPSERPFVITEEDYRRYPYDYGPFVNTVQQALLENTFCLIGFSGDDPNFLQWIGWIRDSLGKDQSQKIYLIGAFNLSSARLQLLANRGIIVVDFSCCNDINIQDHKKALSRFFEFIWSKQPEALAWPYKPKSIMPLRGRVQTKEVQDITKEWQQQRQSYPGWLILPYANRENLWTHTKYWAYHLPNTEESPAGLDIQYAFELIWRLERCLIPVFGKIPEFCEKLLKKYWPFQNRSTPTSCKIHPGIKKFQDLQWLDLRQAWIAIAITMIRFYREKGILEKREALKNRLEHFSDCLSVEQKEFLNYEDFLYYLFTLDLPKAKQHLETWRPNEAHPYWLAKRATAFAEIELKYEQDMEVQLSLVESRRKSNDDTSSPDYSTISNEAYQILLLRYVTEAGSLLFDKPATTEEEQLVELLYYDEWEKENQSQEPDRQTDNSIKPSKKTSNFEEDYHDLIRKSSDAAKAKYYKLLREVRTNQRKRELQQQDARLNELKAYKIDPWNELRLFDLSLKHTPIQGEGTTVKQEFDIGRVTRTISFGSADQEELCAYAFLRFCEEVGLPFRIGSYIMATKTAEASLPHISQYSSFWAIATLIRLGDTKAVDSLFNREFVYRFKSKEADHLIQSYLNALNKCCDDIHVGDAFRKTNYGVRLSQLLPEIISRLCCKCSMKMRRSVLRFIIELYASPDKTNYRKVANLTKRLINSMSEIEQYKIIPDLLKISFPNDLKPIIKDDFPNPLMLLQIKQKPERSSVLKIQSGLVNNLLQQAVSDDSDQRRWAITSLVKLHELDLLSDDQNRKFAEALWSITDDTYGLPRHTDYYNFVFLILPHPEDVNPIKLFKSYVRKTHFPVHGNEGGKAVSLTAGNIFIVQEIIGANRHDENFWTEEDAAKILLDVQKWWDADKDKLKQNDRGFKEMLSTSVEFRSRFVRAISLLADVVCPKLSKGSPDKVKALLNRLVEEMGEHELPVLEAKAAGLHIFPERKTELYGQINEALISIHDNIKKDGLRAIDKIIFSSKHADENSGKSDPTTMLSQYLTWSSTHTITHALGVIIRVLDNSPTNFSPSLELATEKRLEKLLIETAYQNDSPDLTYKDKLEVRQIVTTLTAKLWKYYKSHNLPVPSVVEKWREECYSPNEFAEVKNAWENHYA